MNLFKGLFVDDFHVSVSDIKHEQTHLKPEPKTYEAINRFKVYTTKKARVDASGPVWKDYEESFVKLVVLSSKHWPLHLPIGYVFISFVLCSEIETYNLEEFKKAFGQWMRLGDSREKLYSSYDRKVFYMIDETENFKFETELLYGSSNQPQQNKLDL